MLQANAPQSQPSGTYVLRMTLFDRNRTRTTDRLATGRLATHNNDSNFAAREQDKCVNTLGLACQALVGLAITTQAPNMQAAACRTAV